MPQTRRKTPFSGKAKKQQLKDKRQRKDRGEQQNRSSSKCYVMTSGKDESEEEDGRVLSVNQQPSKLGKRNANRYNLRFHRETEAELQENKVLALKTIEPVEEDNLEIKINDYFPPDLNFPVRPLWDYSLTRDELDAREHRYFLDYIKKIEAKYSWSELSYFELNLETWRQLWRVLEMADVILLITDIRFPALMVPPSLYNYVTNFLDKELIVVLNKIDLAPSPLVVAWKHYLETMYPGIHILMFTSFPSYNLRNTIKSGGLQNMRRRGKMRMAAEGAQKLLDACKDIVKDQVDLTSWQKKIAEEMLVEYDGDEEVEVAETINLKSQDTSFYRHNKFENGVLTIGCIGQPNVGKSSLMNALMGKKVVSVSRTPGHTKHFQTIFLTKTVRLCDCPGLVFPSKVPKSLQILMGSFPIAQLRDPFSCVRFLAERVDLVSLLKIEHPELDEEWSAMDICDGWAKKKGYYTAKAARLDSYRAANHILRMALEGKITFCMRPPEYTATKEKWANHPDIQVVQWIQASIGKQPCSVREHTISDDSEEEEIPQGASKASSNTDPQSLSDLSDESEEENIQSSNKFQALGDED